ncbi:MAG: hypothetical protein Q8Q42_01815 [Nanoarchaeota archaeon]|nr:hypothetical protein [Nanoarchaeota archaeon]
MVQLKGHDLMVWDEVSNLDFLMENRNLYSEEFRKQNAFIFEQSNNKQKVKKTLSHKDKK